MKPPRELPISFSPFMVRACLDGRKTQTRRLVKASNTLVDGHSYKAWFDQLDLASAWVDAGPSPAGNRGPYLKATHTGLETNHRLYPKWNDGDRLWVRESHLVHAYDRSFALYADGSKVKLSDMGYRAAHYMPRKHARLILQLDSVVPQRLQDISVDDVLCEGITQLANGDFTDDPSGNGGVRGETPVDAYAKLWDSLNGDGGWDANPWVWVLRFAVIEKPVDLP